MEHVHSQAHLRIVVSSCLAIMPLAGVLEEATEHIAERTDEGSGGATGWRIGAGQ